MANFPPQNGEIESEIQKQHQQCVHNQYVQTYWMPSFYDSTSCTHVYRSPYVYQIVSSKP